MYQFTKETKTNWINALKSGKYVQGHRQLRLNINGQQHHCCLGVLGEIHPELKINDTGCIVAGNNASYAPFNDMLGGDKEVERIYRANDTSFSEGVRDYSKVIPLIEALPTVD